MIRIRPLAALALAASLASTASAAPTAQSAEAFIRRVYAPYLAGKTDADPTGKAAPAIFAPPLLKLIRQDQAAAGGEVGALDSDPICQCQDFDRLKQLSVAVRNVTPGHATAAVRFVNEGTPEMLTYTLVAVGNDWRVADIGAKEMPSLAGLLRKANGPHRR